MWRDARVMGQPHSTAPRAVRGLVPCSKAPQQCPGGEMAPFQPPVHTPYRLVRAGLEPATIQFASQVPTD